MATAAAVLLDDWESGSVGRHVLVEVSDDVSCELW